MVSIFFNELQTYNQFINILHGRDIDARLSTYVTDA